MEQSRWYVGVGTLPMIESQKRVRAQLRVCLIQSDVVSLPMRGKGRNRFEKNIQKQTKPSPYSTKYDPIELLVYFYKLPINSPGKRFVF